MRQVVFMKKTFNVQEDKKPKSCWANIRPVRSGPNHHKVPRQVSNENGSSPGIIAVAKKNRNRFRSRGNRDLRTGVIAAALFLLGAICPISIGAGFSAPVKPATGQGGNPSTGTPAKNRPCASGTEIPCNPGSPTASRNRFHGRDDDDGHRRGGKSDPHENIHGGDKS